MRMLIATFSLMIALAATGPARAADTGTEPQDSESLSEQLHEDEGVIEPPPVGDSEIEAPAPDPDPGTTVVIPPPGSPGGDPTVQPK